MIYMAVLITGFAFSMLSPKSKRFFYSYLFLLLILASFRYGVGPDYFAYEVLYSLVDISVLEQIGVVSGQELLFRLYGSTLNSIDFSYQQYLALTALVTLYYIGKICKKYSQYPVFSLYLFFCLFYFVWVFSGIRQGLTLAIGVYYLLECLERRKHIKFAIIVFILSLIHAASLILLLFYVVAHLNLRRQTLLLGVFFGFCVSLIPAAYLMEFFNHLPFGERIAYYFKEGSSELTINYFDFKSISRFVLLILIGVVFAKTNDKSSEIQRKIMGLYIASFGIYYALKFVEILAAQASLYGFVLIVLILPNIYGKLKAESNSKVFLIFVLTLSIAFFFKTLYSMEDMSQLNNSSLVTPYTNIFNKSEDTFPVEP
jgi:hypothetical protein